MAGRSGRLAAVRGLMEMGSRPRCSKGAGLHLPPCRRFSSKRVLAPCTLKTCSSLASRSTTKQQSRPFLSLAAPLLGAKRMEYAEVRQLPYSIEQIYNTVADVGSYQLFVPWCTGSRVISHRNGFLQAELEVGFPPVVQRYVSDISLVPLHQIRVVSNEGQLFQHLETLWQFEPGRPGQLDSSCTLKFYVSALCMPAPSGGVTCKANRMCAKSCMLAKSRFIIGSKITLEDLLQLCQYVSLID
nr:coenzyme Q-binding protein COQ10 homolog B, mitochondrial-like isoform X1 [Zootoca vivipara]